VLAHLQCEGLAYSAQEADPGGDWWADDVHAGSVVKLGDAGPLGGQLYGLCFRCVSPVSSCHLCSVKHACEHTVVRYEKVMLAALSVSLWLVYGLMYAGCIRNMCVTIDTPSAP
jgi:hypothetical protein